MDNFKISGDFSFDSHNIESMDKFSFTLHIQIEGLSKEQHIFIKSKISEQLGLRAHTVPTAWGDNPPRYDELIFETNAQDFERCKTMIKLLKEGGAPLTANGYRYPPNSDHPLLAAVHESEGLRRCVQDFNGLKSFIQCALSESKQEASPIRLKPEKKSGPTL